MISAPKTVLVVDDEPAVRWLLQQGLPRYLPDFAIATAGNGQEAIDYLTAYPVDVMVTDITMPVKDGFELLAHVRNHHPNLPVVVLASTAPRRITERAPELGAMHVVQKPASPELVARHITQARAETVRGRMAGVPLSTLLQLMQLERKTCSLLVRSGARKGRLHFLSGELVNAYAFELDVEGEAAARHLLTLDKVTIDFERSLHNHVRRIHTPLETLLLEVATHLDETNRDGASATAAAAAAAPAAAAATAATTIVEKSAAAAFDADPRPAPPVPVAGPPLARAPGPATRESARPVPSLDAAVAGLQVALVGLRARSGAAAEILSASAPDLARGAADLAALAHLAPTVGPDEDRLASAWSEVSELAARLVRAADALEVRGGTADA